MPETTTTYSGMLDVDGKREPITVAVPGLANEHRRDHAIVRTALRATLERMIRPEGLATDTPPPQRIAITVQIGQGTEIREEVQA